MGDVVALDGRILLAHARGRHLSQAAQMDLEVIEEMPAPIYVAIMMKPMVENLIKDIQRVGVNAEVRDALRVMGVAIEKILAQSN